MRSASEQIGAPELPPTRVLNPSSPTATRVTSNVRHNTKKPMAVILFIDMLGARRLWQRGGVDESLHSFYRFKKMVNIAVRRAPAGEILDGLIETDAAMLVCRTTVEAARIAQRLYQRAFLGRMNASAPRHWFRGCIVPHVDGEFLRAGDVLRQPVQRITAWRYSRSALEAVSVEKSGIQRNAYPGEVGVD